MLSECLRVLMLLMKQPLLSDMHLSDSCELGTFLERRKFINFHLNLFAHNSFNIIIY